MSKQLKNFGKNGKANKRAIKLVLEGKDSSLSRKNPMYQVWLIDPSDFKKVKFVGTFDDIVHIKNYFENIPKHEHFNTNSIIFIAGVKLSTRDKGWINIGETGNDEIEEEIQADSKYIDLPGKILEDHIRFWIKQKKKALSTDLREFGQFLVHFSTPQAMYTKITPTLSQQLDRRIALGQTKISKEWEAAKRVGNSRTGATGLDQWAKNNKDRDLPKPKIWTDIQVVSTEEQSNSVLYTFCAFIGGLVELKEHTALILQGDSFMDHWVDLINDFRRHNKKSLKREFAKKQNGKYLPNKGRVRLNQIFSETTIKKMIDQGDLRKNFTEDNIANKLLDAAEKKFKKQD